MKAQKVIIVGAGRSGTNMLRDILEQLPGASTWDCDEINPVWRHGNARNPTDSLTPSHIKRATRRAVNRSFEKQAQRADSQIVIEKTCANSLRVPFVYDLCPDAKYIFIFRDGRDVVPSAMKRWVSKLDIKYTLKKMKFVPIVDFPYYLFKFGFNRVKRIFIGKERLSFWGPIYKGMDADVRDLSLAEVAAKQWASCVLHTTNTMDVVPEENRITVHYEKFVNSPMEQVMEIAKFIGISQVNDDLLNEMVKGVSTKSVGSYNRNLTADELSKILPLCEKAMIQSGYSYE